MIFSLIFSIAVPLSAQAVEYAVSTYAGGGGTPGCSTTATATNAVSIDSPWSIAADSAGNVYYANRNTYSVCKIRTDGTVIRVAGTGSQGIGADNIQATSSALWDPSGIAVDSTGVLYIAEYSGSRSIRRVGLDGVITTIFNTARSNTSSGAGGLATAASAKGPISLAIAPDGDIYFSDSDGNYIRRIDSNGYMQAVAGTGTRGTSGDGGAATSAQVAVIGGLAFDSIGNLYLASYHGYIRKISTSGIISRVAGSYSGLGHTGNDGPATSATFRNLWGIAIDSADNIFIAERGGSPAGTTIRKVNISSGIVTTIAGVDGLSGSADGQSSSARFNSPYSVAIGPTGDVFVGDLGSARIRKIAQAAVMSSPDSTAPTFTNSSTFSLAENTSTSTNAATITVNESATITITSGTDSALFTIITSDSVTARVRFLTSPDFEAPTDVGTNNVYDISVRATDTAGNIANQSISITITNVNESASIGAPTVSGAIYKGINTTITVTSSVAGTVRFFVGGKRITSCLARATSGSYPNYTSTCTWKPAVQNGQLLTATLTPTDNTFSAATSAATTVLVVKRGTTR